jgi:hypothetical protein
VGLKGGKTRFIRPRTIFYTFMLLAGVVAFAFATTRISPLRASAVRMIGAPFYIADGVVRNQFLIRVINKRDEPARYRLELVGEAPAELQASGLDQALQVAPMGEEQKTLVLSLPEAAFQKSFRLRVKVTDADRGDSMMTRVMEFLGPDPRLRTHAPLDPKAFLQ